MMQEHEQALIAAIARLADSSDCESGNNKHEQMPKFITCFTMLFHIISQLEKDFYTSKSHCCHHIH